MLSCMGPLWHLWIFVPLQIVASCSVLSDKHAEWLRGKQYIVDLNAPGIQIKLCLIQGEVWDSNGGSNFYIRVSQLPPGVTRGPIPPLDPRARSNSSASTSSHQTLDEVARRHTGQLYFSYPERLVAGQTAMLYMNRRNRYMNSCGHLVLQWCKYMIY
jgi:hypothetical protein